MSLKITLLKDLEHRDFLLLRRYDPVSRKLFVAGDRLTRCASCLQQFLEQSWKAIGSTHCGQVATVLLDESDPAAPGQTKQTQTRSHGNGKRPRLDPIPSSLMEIPVTLH